MHSDRSFGPSFSRSTRVYWVSGHNFPLPFIDERINHKFVRHAWEMGILLARNCNKLAGLHTTGSDVQNINVSNGKNGVNASNSDLDCVY